VGGEVALRVTRQLDVDCCGACIVRLQSGTA
jgi:hypothetical protein